MNVNINETLEVVGAAGGAIGTLILVYSKIIAPIYKSLHRRVANTISKIEQISEIWEILHKEFRPNGGSSFRDAVVRLEEKAELHHEMLKAFFDSDEHGRFLTDADGGILWTNRTYLRKINTSSSEATGMGWVNTIKQDDREMISEEWKSAKLEKREIRMDYTMINQLDQEFKVSLVAIPIFDHSKNIKSWLGTLTFSE